MTYAVLIKIEETNDETQNIILTYKANKFNNNMIDILSSFGKYVNIELLPYEERYNLLFGKGKKKK